MVDYVLASRFMLTIMDVDHGVGGDILHDVVVLQLARVLLLLKNFLLVFEVFGFGGPVSGLGPLDSLADEVSDQFDDLPVAVGRLRVGEAGQGGGGPETSPLRLHLGSLPSLRLAELGGDDDQTQVDHEEGANLQKQDPSQFMTTSVPLGLPSTFIEFGISVQCS